MTVERMNFLIRSIFVVLWRKCFVPVPKSQGNLYAGMQNKEGQFLLLSYYY